MGRCGESSYGLCCRRRPRFTVSRNVTIRARLRRPQLGFLYHNAFMWRAARTVVPCRSSGCWNAGPAANSHRSRQVAADRQEVLTLRYLDGTQRKYVVIKHVKHAKSATWSQWDDRLKHVLEIGLVVYQCQVEPARRRSCVVRYDHSTPGLDSSRK